MKRFRAFWENEDRITFRGVEADDEGNFVRYTDDGGYVLKKHFVDYPVSAEYADAFLARLPDEVDA